MAAPGAEPVTRQWVGMGSPLDCSGSGRGEGDAPAVIRAAGLLTLLGADDLGDVHGPITDRQRDEASGVLALAQVRDALRAVREAVDGACGRGATPLVLGGDCSFVIGALAGARRHHPRLGAAFLDGHVDSYDGATSPTGEVADMDIGIVCGAGPAALRGLDGAPDPLVRPGDCVVVGNRFEDVHGEPDERELAHPLIQQISGAALRRADAAQLGEAVAERLAAQAGAFWLHVDCDVLDEAVMPAVTYTQPDGATWDDLEALIGSVRAPARADRGVARRLRPRPRSRRRARGAARGGRGAGTSGGQALDGRRGRASRHRLRSRGRRRDRRSCSRSASPEVDLKAVTTVAGNLPLETTTRNALRVLALAGREDVPVAAGAARPARRAARRDAAVVHGADGLGGAPRRESSAAVVPMHARRPARPRCSSAATSPCCSRRSGR